MLKNRKMMADRWCPIFCGHLLLNDYSAANEYSWYSNNCWQVIRDGIYEAFYPNGNYYCDNSWIPNIAYWNNYINPQGPESLDFDQVMNGILE